MSDALQHASTCRVTGKARAGDALSACLADVRLARQVRQVTLDRNTLEIRIVWKRGPPSVFKPSGSPVSTPGVRVAATMPGSTVVELAAMLATPTVR